jgi:hypothetical protein
LPETVEHAALARAFLKQDVIAEVEIAPGRGHRAKFPAHALAIGRKLVERSARGRDEADVVVLEMLPRPI